MPSYPSSIASFPTQVTHTPIPSANQNNVQAEITALETAILSGGLQHLVQSTGLRFTAASTLTLASHVITATLFHHAIDTQGGASTDQLNQILLGSVSNGIALGAESLLLLTPANTAHVVTVNHLTGGGNIVLVGTNAYVMSDAASALLLRYDGTNWNEVSRTQVVATIGTPQSYSPAWTGSGGNPAIGNGTLTGSYIQIGKLVFFTVLLTMGSTTTFGSGTYSFTLPGTSAASNGVVGTGKLANVGTNSRIAQAFLQTATTFGLQVDQDTGVGITPTSPFTFANGDFIYVEGTYIST
jgi:hypothetical protein